MGAPPPNPENIPKGDLLDVTVVLLTCSYKEQEFIRIGYYVHNEYEEQMDSNDENIEIEPDKIQRNILEDKPRVTRFNIAWDGDKDKMKTDGGDDETKENENENDAQYEEDEEEEEEDEEDDDVDDVDDLEEVDLQETELKDILKQK